MVKVIGLKFYLTQSLHLCLTFEVKGFILCVIEFFQCYSIQLPSPESKLHTLCSLKSGGSAGRGIHAPLGTLSSSSVQKIEHRFLDILYSSVIVIYTNIVYDVIKERFNLIPLRL